MKRVYKFIIILGLVLVIVVIAISFMGINQRKATGNFSENAWMAKVDDGEYISEISIPGTHDTCALYEPWQGVVKCQTYSLRDQLDMGVRFIDIRGRVNFSKVNIYHGITYQCLDLEQVFDICSDFLTDNPTETIIMSIKQEGAATDRFVSLVNNIADNCDLTYSENRIPTLGEARGKIILFNRYTAETERGLYAYGFNSGPVVNIDNGNHKIVIQDNYSVDDNRIKWDNITYLYGESVKNSNPNTLFINFSSGTNSNKPHIKEFKEDINPKLEEFFSKADSGCYGITVIDYITPDMCKMIINKNFSENFN